ncbi:DUF7594 domain-containing protein [Myxococcus stipitatus]|uniref:CBM96 family carbohydrate-binding protein n=1 Tax=Myxococcus stipitatus TaxID=83455 RepID=UPI0030D3E268
MKSKTWLSVSGWMSLGGLLVGGDGRPVAADSSAPPECEAEIHLGQLIEYPDADTYVEEAFPNAEHSHDAKLSVDGSPHREVYLRFRVDYSYGLGATLRLPVVNGTVNAPALYSTLSGWEEYMTWNTRPPLQGGPVANAGAVPTGSVLSYDVRHVVTRPGLYSFALIPESRDGMDIRSKDDWPLEQSATLVVTFLRSNCTHSGRGGALGPPWRYGARGDEVARAMATDATGAFVIAGAYGVGGRLGPVDLPGPGGLMLGRFRADGSHEWSRGQAQASATLSVEDAVLTSQGDILVAGSYTGTPDLGTGPLPAAEATASAMFIARFSPGGVPVWAKGFVARVGPGDASRRVPAGAKAVATDAQGRLIVTGFFHGTMNLGGGGLEAGPSSRDVVNPKSGMFVARFSSEGTHLWSLAYPGLGGESTQGFRVVTDSMGHVVVGGVASGNGVSERVLGARHGKAPVIAKFSPEGVLQWTRVLEFAEGAVAGLAILPGDAVAFSGSFRPSFSFGAETIYSFQSGHDPERRIPDAMMGVLESWGADRWARALGEVGREHAVRMAVDSQGRLIVLGELAGSSSVGGGSISTGGTGFVASYEPGDGAHRWSRALPAGLEPALLGVTRTGDVRAGGSFKGLLRVREVTHSSEGGSDVMLLNMSP